MFWPGLCVFRLQPIREAHIQGRRAGSLQDPQRRHGEECVWGRLHQHPHLPQQGNTYIHYGLCNRIPALVHKSLTGSISQCLTLSPSAANDVAGSALWGGAWWWRKSEANWTQPERHSGDLAPQPPDCYPQLCECAFLCSAASLWLCY